MKDSIQVVNFASISRDDWVSLYKNSACSNPFLHYDWIKSISVSFPSWKIKVLVSIKNGQIVAICPVVERKILFLRSIELLPFGTYGGVVAKDKGERAEVLKMLSVSLAKGCFSRSIYTPDPLGEVELPIAEGLSELKASSSIIDLSNGYEEIYSGYKHNVRKNLKKAAASSLEVVRISSREEIKDFFEIASYTYKMHSGRMPYPLHFYESIFDYCVPSGLAEFYIVLKDNKPIAGSVHFYSEKQVMNWLTPAYREYQEYRANTYLIDLVIKDACKRGIQYYNLGGSPLGGGELSRFKESWGAIGIEYPQVWYRGTGISVLEKTYQYLNATMRVNR